MTLDVSAPPVAGDEVATDAAPATPEAVYQARTRQFAAERDRYAQQWNRLSNIRLLVFAGAVGCLGIAIQQSLPIIGGAGAVLLIVFAGLVGVQRRVGRLRARYAELWAINDEALLRLVRAWDALPLRHTERADPAHPFAVDLDLFGRGSLFHLLESVSTRMGETTLRDWLLAPAAPPTVNARQAAVGELAPLIDLRDELALRGRLMGEGRPDPAPFLAWAEAKPWLRARPALVWGGWASVGALWALIIAQATGLVPWPLWLVFLAVNWLHLTVVGRRVAVSLNQVDSNARAFGYYADSLELLAESAFQAPLLHELQAQLRVEGAPAHAQLRRLHRLIGWRFPQASMLYGLIQLFFLWDTQVLTALEGWQAGVGPRARGWLAALGQAEALAALAELAHDNPDWAFPAFDPAAQAFEARALGHPLLARTGRVLNDVTVGPPGTFLLVTGSNMSGKSTLLRAIGVNIVLAGAGGPVCAAALRLPPVELWTSMRITDSLAAGVSYYMAELQRLKAIVDAARAERGPGAPRLFYLLDEILQGTNTAERQIAARRVILHLVRRGALGAVSTHDLTLAESPPMAAAARPIHFTEQFTNGPEGPAMRFDYTVRPGLATSTNALRLMEIVGLHLDEV